MTYTAQQLSLDEIKQFKESGFVHIKGVISKELAESCAQTMIRFMGITDGDPESWRDLYFNAKRNRALDSQQWDDPRQTRYNYKEYAPKLYYAMCDLMGGPERLKSDGFRDNGVYTLSNPDIFKGNEDPESLWQPPVPRGAPGIWHVDGGPWFTHYLDSSEVGLLVLILYRDTHKKGGATYFAPESPKIVSNYYNDTRNGTQPNSTWVIEQCSDFRAAVGKAGDAFILHPFMMHSGNMNVFPTPRLMENDNVSFHGEAMKFDWDNYDDASIVEQSILDHIGVTSLDFQRK